MRRRLRAGPFVVDQPHVLLTVDPLDRAVGASVTLLALLLLLLLVRALHCGTYYYTSINECSTAAGPALARFPWDQGVLEVLLSQVASSLHRHEVRTSTDGTRTGSPSVVHWVHWRCVNWVLAAPPSLSLARSFLAPVGEMLKIEMTIPRIPRMDHG